MIIQIHISIIYGSVFYLNDRDDNVLNLYLFVLSCHEQLACIVMSRTTCSYCHVTNNLLELSCHELE